MIKIVNKTLEKKLKNPYQEYHEKTWNEGILYPKYKDDEVWDLENNIKDRTKWEYVMKKQDLAFLVSELWFNWRALHFIEEWVNDTYLDRKKHLKDPNYQKQCRALALGEDNEPIC